MTRRTWTTLCCMTVLLHAAMVHPSVNGIDFGRLLKRPRKQQQKQLQDEADPEAQMNEVLSYKTACDQQLAQTMVILGEQKTAAEEALGICREHRTKAHADVEYLSKKVDIQRNELNQADALCEDKLRAQESDIHTQLEEVQTKLNQTDSAMAMLKEEHAVALQTLLEGHSLAMEDLKLTHGTKVEQLQREHQEEMNQVNQKLEQQKEDQQLERQTADTTLQNTKAEHQKAMAALEKDYQSQLEATQKAVQQQLDQTESELKQQIQSLTDKVTSCDASLVKSKKELQTVQGDYERALQKIAVLEDVTAWTLAVQEARDVVQYTKTELQDHLWMPLYQQYQIEAKVNTITQEYTKVKKTAQPVLQPVLRPIGHATQRLIDYHRSVANKAFAKTQSHFVNNACPTARQFSKKLQSPHKTAFKDYQQKLSESIDSACENPTPFLTNLGYGMLFLIAFFLRWFILRTIFAILLLPFRILFFPFIIVANHFLASPTIGPSKNDQNNVKDKKGKAITTTNSKKQGEMNKK